MLCAYHPRRNKKAKVRLPERGGRRVNWAICFTPLTPAGETNAATDGWLPIFCC